MGDYQELLNLKRQTPDWGNLKLVQFERNIYVEHVATRMKPPQEVARYRDTHKIIIESESVPPNPVMSFSESGLPQYALEVCASEGFRRPTPIQSQVWPCILGGKDMVVMAATGSGKTLCYVIPAVCQIMNQPLLEPNDGPIALVLCPTRELAVQIHDEADKFCSPCRLRCCSIYGGVSKQQQIQQLARGAELVVATPGRLLDLLDMNATNLLRVTMVVLDEADRMLNMGFEQFVRRIEVLIRPTRQTVLITATLPQSIEALADSYLRGSKVTVKIGISGVAGELASCANVEQEVRIVTSDDARMNLFTEDMRRITLQATKTLVFCNTKVKVDELHELLQKKLSGVEKIHGGMEQRERDRVVTLFKNRERAVLVSTGLMGRGIDIPSVTHVVSYDFPPTIEEYVHRVGRTGRGSTKGNSLVYISHQNYSLVPDLIDFLSSSGQVIPDTLYSMLPTAMPTPPAKRMRITPPDVQPAWRKSGTATSTATLTARRPTVERTTYFTLCPSTVLLLRNVVGPGDVDEHTKEDIWSECEKLSGGVLDVVIYEHKRWNRACSLAEEEMVRIFVKFRSKMKALDVYKVMQGRQFGGRTVVATFYDPADFDRNELAPSDHEPAMTTTLLLRNMVTPDEVDEDLVPDVVSEMSTFGKVETCQVEIVPLTSPYTHLSPAERVRIFVQFSSFQAALQAFVNLDSRSFNNRELSAHLFDTIRWNMQDLAPSDTTEPPLPLRCFMS